MSRAYVVYVLTFIALIGGLLLVMTMGDALRAPDDLSGDWVIEWDNAPPPESGEPTLRIAQSGRFFVVTFGQAEPMSMRLQDGWTGKNKGRKLSMTLARPQWELRLNGEIPGKSRWQIPEMNLELVGRTRHVGIARRVLPQTAEEAPAEAGEPAKASARIPTSDSVPLAPSVPSETAHAR